MTTSTAATHTADALAGVLDDLATVLDGTTPERSHDPTPCSEFDVAMLRGHIVGWLTTFAAGFADPEGNAPRASLDGYRAPDYAAGAVREAAAELDAAVRAGAASRPLRLGEAAMPGELALGMILWEYLVHGWDLARATGQPWSPSGEAAAESLAFAPSMLTGDFQGEGKEFAPRIPVPENAPAMDRLLGLSGRDPDWTR
ncbi:MAG: TIGR03086 family metal-binding protein [Streptosporangiales bacterium]